MSLSGCSIAVSGKFLGYTQAKLKALMTNNGAKFEASGVTSTTTHLIAQLPEFDKPSQKLSNAWAKGIPAVSLDWLLDSAKENKRLDESNYSYKPPGSQEDDVQDGNKRKKIEPVNEVEEPQEKSAKRRRGKRAAPEPAADDVQDTVMGEPAEELVEEKSKRGRWRPNVVKAEAPEEEKEGEAAKEKELQGPRKRGRPAKKNSKPELDTNSEKTSVGETLSETGQTIEVRDVGVPKRSGRFAKKDIKPQQEVDGVLKKKQDPEVKVRESLEQGDNMIKGDIINVEEPRKSGRLARKPTKPEPEADAEEAPVGDLTSKKKQKILATKSTDGIKAAMATEKKNVPIDASCPLIATHRVYIDPSGAIFDAALNQTSIGKNNNKFYLIQLLEPNVGKPYATWTHWGRVGEFGQSALFNNQTLEGAKKIFEKKFTDKSGLKWEDRHNPPKVGKYTFIEKNYMDDEDDQEEFDSKVVKPESKPVPASKLSPELQSLMRLIFNPDHMVSSMASMRYDANKLPLGKLSKKTLSQGFAALKDLGEVVTNPTLAQSKYREPLRDVLEDLTSKYYTVIPHSFGRMRPPVIDSEAALKREIELIETLGDMEIANEIMKDAEYLVDADGIPINPLDSQFNSLNLEKVSVVNKSTTEFVELEAYLQKSQKYLTQCRLVEVFRITRPGEAERFEEGGFSASQIDTHKINDSRKLLWHGSRSTNFGGILSQGLRIAPPEAPVNGYAFGKGIYLADLASKSFEYLYPGTSGNQGLLMLCEAQLGDPVYERYTHDSDAASNSKKNGALSTWALGKTQPVGWKDAGVISQELKGVLMPDVDKGLMNPQNMPPQAWIPDNEYIVYSVAQVKIRYLFRVDFSLTAASVASAASNCNVV